MGRGIVPGKKGASSWFQRKTKEASEATAAEKASSMATLAGMFSASPSKGDPGSETCMILMRHSERLDHVDPQYRRSSAGSVFPFDAPITAERGVAIAKKAAQKVASVRAKAPFIAVATSPYRRCVETAAEVAKLMNLPIILDQELGEVWGACMPPVPNPWRRPLELEKMISKLGVRCLNPLDEHGGILVYGRAPSWPEELEVAHGRFIVRVQRYLHMSAKSQKNFIIVTHADCVAAAMIKFERHTVNPVGMDYCATVIARCQSAPKEGNVYVADWKAEVAGVKVDRFNKDENRHVQRCQEIPLAPGPRSTSGRG